MRSWLTERAPSSSRGVGLEGLGSRFPSHPAALWRQSVLGPPSMAEALEAES